MVAKAVESMPKARALQENAKKIVAQRKVKAPEAPVDQRPLSAKLEE